MLATVTEGGSSAGPHPFVATVMALRLLFEDLEVAAHQLVAREHLEGGAFLVGELFEVLRVFEPLLQLVADGELSLDPVEHLGEGAVEGVEVRLALDETGPREVVEGQQARAVLPHGEGAHQHHPFLDGDGDACFAQCVEELEEHVRSDPY